MPWRNTHDAYAIWLSEVMLQQTQVKTALPYYERFLTRYPTIASLAQAPPSDVLKLWEGLGYYSRCRNLHKAAQLVMERHGGVFPNTMEAVDALPGIGRSTAGAILTFAYGQTHPLLDGNVKRVLSRLDDVADPVTQPAVIASMWTRSTQLLEEADDPYTFNQAIMELGATLCTQKHPQCLVCPVAQCCKANAHGTQHDRPVKVQKAPIPHKTIAVGVIWQDETRQKVLIQQRPEGALLGGLWEFPGGKQEADETLPQTVARELAEELGISVQVQEKIIAVKHAYTHYKITLHAYHCLWTGGKPTPTAAQQWAWVGLDQLEAYAFPKANKSVLQALLTPAH
jgi:A/G-specific adenine glycosylase